MPNNPKATRSKQTLGRGSAAAHRILLSALRSERAAQDVTRSVSMNWCVQPLIHPDANNGTPCAGSSGSPSDLARFDPFFGIAGLCEPCSGRSGDAIVSVDSVPPS
jgi:hypothetical protein